MTIRLLPIQLANQIAAGEVVERPASVIKELVENSIDAGATDIHIEIDRGGHRRMLIRDNGKGIPQEELSLALSRHATSKIANLTDLEAIYSLGFRGEALASISSVARLTLTSKPAQQETAYSAYCEGRDMQVQVTPAAHPDGTSVEVADLFYNTPARRKFLRTEKTEFTHIQEVVRRIALAYPHIRFYLEHNGKQVHVFPAVAKADTEQSRVSYDDVQRLTSIVGQAFVKDALYFEHNHQDFHLQGWLAPPQSCRYQPDIQYFFVNGRAMRDRLLNHAIRQAYTDLLAADRVPTYVLYLSLPAHEVDVNVHPAKHEVRFHQGRQVHDFILSSIQDALQQSGFQQQPLIEHQYTAPSYDKYQQTAPQLQTREPQAQTADTVAARYTAYKHKPALSKEALANWQALLAPQSQKETSERWQFLYTLDEQWGVVAQQEKLALVSLQALQASVVRQRIEQALPLGLTGQPLLVPTQIKRPQLRQQIQKYHAHLSTLGVLLKPLKADACAIVQVPEVLRHTSVAESLDILMTLLEAQEPQVELQERSDILQWLAEQAPQPSVGGAISALWEQLKPAWYPPMIDLNWQQAVL